MLRPPRFLLIAVVIGLIHAASAAPDASPDATRITADLQVTLLRDGVWLHTSWNTYEGTRVPSNGLLVREGDGLILVDTAWGVQPTIDLLTWIDRELKLPITRAIVTHAHADRMGGIAALTERSIPVSCHPLTSALAPRKGWPAPAALTAIATAGSHTALDSLEVFHPGPGHTADNITVWIPAARVLFGGCAVKSAGATDLGFIGEADLAAWPDSIRRLQERYVDPAAIVVPGHGQPGGRELLQHTLELLRRKTE